MNTSTETSSRTPPPVVVPNVDDLTHAGFWQAAADGRLVIEVCRPAGHVLHLPRGYCHRCDTFDVEWKTVAGDATVHTFTIVEHSVDSAFPAPYTVVLVELDAEPGVRFVSSLPGRVDLEVGQRMVIRFDEIVDGVTVPRWEPAG